MDDKIEALKAVVKPVAPKPAPKAAAPAPRPAAPAPKPVAEPEPVVTPEVIEDPEAANLSPSVLAERAAGRAALKK